MGEQADRGGDGRRRVPPAALVLLPLPLLGLALNPYLLPGSYDNVTYFLGAQSLARTGTYAFNGSPVTDWAPGLPLVLSLLFRLELGSGLGGAVVGAKGVILACVALSLVGAARLFREERRAYPVTSCAIAALLPTGFMMGTRIMSEWPYMALSFLFLAVLRWLKPDRTTWTRALAYGAVAGLILGAASLTRWVGVMLGAAVVTQALLKLRESWLLRNGCSRWIVVLPEVVTAVVGGACFLGWRTWATSIARVGEFHSRYYPDDWLARLFSSADFVAVPFKVSDLLVHASSLTRFAGLEDSPVALLWAIPGLVVLLGAGIRLRAKGICPGDGYVLAYLVLFAFQTPNLQVRLLLPVAPFLVSYLLEGLRFLLRVVTKQREVLVERLLRNFMAAWMLLLAMFAVHLLVRGNFTDTHGGLSLFASGDAGSFYRRNWSALHEACELVRADREPGAVGTLTGKSRYVVAFTGRRTVDYPFEKPVRWILVEAPEELSDADLRGFRRVATVGEISLFRVATPPSG